VLGSLGISVLRFLIETTLRTLHALNFVYDLGLKDVSQVFTCSFVETERHLLATERLLIPWASLRS
jgi:hypothetical protein